jgi:hypothetical protein
VAGTGSNSARDADFPDCVFHNFSLFLQANAGCFLVHSLEFIIQSSSYLSILYNLSCWQRR